MQTTTPTASFNPIQPAVVPQQQPIAPRPTVTQPTHIPSVLNTPAQTQQAHVPSVLTTLPLQQIINAPATPQAPAEQPVLPQMPVVQSPNLGGNKIAVEALKCRVQKLILELDSIHKELTALEQKLN